MDIESPPTIEVYLIGAIVFQSLHHELILVLVVKYLENSIILLAAFKFKSIVPLNRGTSVIGSSGLSDNLPTAFVV